jgi:hypothetical protein
MSLTFSQLSRLGIFFQNSQKSRHNFVSANPRQPWQNNLWSILACSMYPDDAPWCSLLGSPINKSADRRLTKMLIADCAKCSSLIRKKVLIAN